MNPKKNKNKNRPNKPPNPSPPQKIEEVISIDKKPVQQISETVESATKIEERVPEILSEVVPSHELDSGEKNDETPKKPKRNRGKKKNQDTDCQKIDLESDIVRQEVLLDMPNIAPTTPKKKNKEKGKEDKEIEKVDDQKIKTMEAIYSETAIKQTIEASISDNLSEQDVKPPKKKNKKKKHRTESEKSEKLEEVSCISAFQKLLKNEDSEILGENIDLPICKEKITKTYKNELENVILPEVNILIEKSINEEKIVDSSKHIITDNAKGKKKNKKDKSYSQNENVKGIVSNIVSDTKIKGDTENILELELTDVKKEAFMTEDKSQSNLSENLIPSEETLKSKARIAKPVERKRKGKDSDQTKDVSSIQDEDHPVTDRNKHDITGNIKCEQIVAEIKSRIKSDGESNKKDVLQNSCQSEDLSIINITKVDEIYKEKSVALESDLDSVKKKKKSPKHKKDLQTIESKIQTNVPLSEIVEKQMKKNVSEIEVVAGEKTREELVEPILGTEVFKETEKSKKKENKSPKSTKDSQTLDLKIQTQEPLCEIVEKRAEKYIPEIEVITDKRQSEKFVESSVRTEVFETVAINVAEKPKKKEKKSPKPKNDPQKVDFEIQTPLSEACLIEKVPEKKVIDFESKSEESVEFTGRTEIFEVAATQMMEKSKKKEKKSSQSKEDPQIIDFEIQTQAQLSEMIETRLIKKVPEKEKSEEFVESTGQTEVFEEVATKVEEKSKKKGKKSPKPKNDYQITEFDIQTQTPLSEIVETQMESNISEMEVIDDEKMSEEFVEPIVKTEDFDKEATKVAEKPKKKEKKSPKLLFESKAKNEHQYVGDESNKQCFVKESKKSDKHSIEITSHMPTLDEIEISSLKAEESEGSSCDVIPDMIQYPRATSQDIIDDNNNAMSIQEITFTEETKLRIPVKTSDTPLISGSGETPLDTPEIAIVCNVSKNVNIQKSQPIDSGKTDLKSKMMEVNQDMEELKLSIEKSLAELTNLEKEEEEIEKEFTDRMLTITEEAQLKEIKQHISNKDVGKLTSEKEFVTLDVDSENQKSMSKNESKAGTKFCNKIITHSDEKNMEDKDITESTLSAAIEPYRIEMITDPVSSPACPVRKDNKNKKSKLKKKGYQEASPEDVLTTCDTSNCEESQKTEEEKLEQKPDSSKEKTKKQSEKTTNDDEISVTKQNVNQNVSEFDPIENFEDAMTSSADDINKSFEMIANDVNQVEASLVNPEINIIAPMEDKKQEQIDDKINPVSQPKNLLGHFEIPVRSNNMDYKKEKNKVPNEVLAKVKIKDSIAIEAKKQSKESQTENIRKFIKNKSIEGPFSIADENKDFVYKYNFRKVFLQSSCHVCKKDLKQSRVPCNYCNLVFYCSRKHTDEDWPQHQALCFAVSTIGHLKDQKHIYADARAITGQNYRLLRMQMIISCEKVLKRRLVPWEQEALLYPRICADINCREWQQSKLVDCDGCHQISYCSAYPDHYPKSHQRWCKSYSLYQKLVSYQQTKGRLEPKLPTKILIDYQIPDKMNEVLASMYEEKIDMSDIQYAALTQIATAPLTAAYCYQIARKNQPLANIIFEKSTCTIHVVDAELQFEADALNKWEVFFLHLSPVNELRVVMISSNLNPGNLPLELLSRIKLCENCRLHNRKLIFKFHDKQTYCDYWADGEYITPNIVCAFNVNISRSSIYNTKDPWPKTLNCIFKQKVPFLVTAHTLNELQKDMSRVTECAEQKFKFIVEPKINNFASVRPDRNFITDDEMPLLFKNYCYTLLVGV